MNGADPKTDEIDKVGVDGTMRYFDKDLQINLENASMLVAAEAIQAPTVGIMTKTGFVEGWKTIGFVVKEAAT